MPCWPRSRGPAAAFCGFYVAKADSKLFNKSSKVVLARDGNTTAITMASDYEGEPKEFAVVIPVPTFIERKQIGVVDMKTIDHLDAYTAPRLVEYHDDDPCTPSLMPMVRRGGALLAATPGASRHGRLDERYKGVTIEANYDVGEYDVSILSAQESDGLVNFLNDNGYKIPAGADAVLGSYIKQKMRFFIAKVNLDRMAEARQRLPAAAAGALRDAEIHAADPARHRERERAAGPDHLCAQPQRPRRDRELSHRQAAVRHRRAAVRQGRLSATFYKAMFDRAVERENMRAVFVEYAWDMAWCDPCAADPLSNKELVELGARWIASDDDKPFRSVQGANAYVTRLHVRYDAQSFPEDLVLTGDARPLELPGPLRAAPSLERADGLRGRRQVSRRAAEALRAGGAEPRQSHRLAAGRTCSPRWKRPGSRRGECGSEIKMQELIE